MRPACVFAENTEKHYKSLGGVLPKFDTGDPRHRARSAASAAEACGIDERSQGVWGCAPVNKMFGVYPNKKGRVLVPPIEFINR